MVSAVARPRIGPCVDSDYPVLDADTEFALLQQADCPRLYARRARNLSVYRDVVHNQMSTRELAVLYQLDTHTVTQSVRNVALMLLEYREKAYRQIDMENQIRWHMK